MIDRNYGIIVEGSDDEDGDETIVVRIKMLVLFLTSSHATYCSKGGGWTQTQILTKTELCQHHWNTTQSQHEKVRNQKCRCVERKSRLKSTSLQYNTNKIYTTLELAKSNC